MSLWHLQVSDCGTILGFDEGMPALYRQRLADLGFEKGSEVKCMRKLPFKGPHLFEVRGSVYALDEEIALKISVKES